MDIGHELAIRQVAKISLLLFTFAGTHDDVK